MVQELVGIAVVLGGGNNRGGNGGYRGNSGGNNRRNDGPRPPRAPYNPSASNRSSAPVPTVPPRPELKKDEDVPKKKFSLFGRSK